MQMISRVSSPQETTDSAMALERTHWFVQDRFGMFIHWGLFSGVARSGKGGMIEYTKSLDQLTDDQYAPYFDTFDPDRYDPVAWARLAKRAGMRYAVLTTKHHDGFCLWDSHLTDYKAPNTPAGRDLLRPWVDAFRAEGIKIGFYYSLIDWHHPQFAIDGFHPLRNDLAARAAPRDMEQYVDYLHGQVRELLTAYGPVDILWLDFSNPEEDWGWSKGKGQADWHAEQLVAMIRELAPNILLNNRLDLPSAADFVTPEQVQPLAWPEIAGQRVTWEACHTLNGSWGYDRDATAWKSPDLLARLLIDSVAKGGNMLLNVGPTARGTIDPQSRATLETLGVWMDLHSPAIYGATASTLVAPPDTRLTQRGNRLYLHLFAWPLTYVFLAGLAHRVTFARFLHDGSEIRLQHGILEGSHTVPQGVTADTVTLELPSQRPDVLIPVIELLLTDG